MFPIKTVTKLGEAELMECNEIVIRRRQRIMLPILAVLVIVYTALMVMLKVKGGRLQLQHWVFEAIFVLYLLLYAVGLKLLMRRSVKKLLERTGERTMTCEFYEDRVEIVTEGERVNGSNTYEYTLLTAVTETEAFFYPAFARSVMPVSKQGLDVHQVSALRETFRKHVPERKYEFIKR